MWFHWILHIYVKGQQKCDVESVDYIEIFLVTAKNC